jgi:peptidoglycan/LPS O-acetylase OafA/YrhL
VSAPLVAGSGERIPSLDGFRGVAMLIVVACHLIWATGPLVPLDQVLVRGWVGVDLFFVLSGFLITGILVDARSRDGYFADFYRRRALRIFPIYFLLLAIYFYLVPMIIRASGARLHFEYLHLIRFQEWYWLYGVNILHVIVPNRDWVGTDPLWSLSVEEQFYLVWPLVIYLVPRRRLALACGTIIAAAIMFRLWLILGRNAPYAAYVLTPARMDALGMGALLAVLARDERASAWLRRNARAILAVAAVTGLGMIVVFGEALMDPAMGTIGYTTTALFGAAVILHLLAFRDSSMAHALARPFMRNLGAWSYGAYLYHLPLIHLCRPWRDRIMEWNGGLPGHFVWIAGMLFLVIGTAALSYHLIERPILAMRDRRWLARPAVEPQVVAP